MSQIGYLNFNGVVAELGDERRILNDLPFPNTHKRPPDKVILAGDWV